MGKRRATGKSPVAATRNARATVARIFLSLVAHLPVITRAGIVRAEPRRFFRGGSSQSPEGVGGDAEDVFEGAGEMKLIAETGAFGDLLDQGAGLFQPFGSEVHFQSHQKFIWTLVVVALE